MTRVKSFILKQKQKPMPFAKYLKILAIIFITISLVTQPSVHAVIPHSFEFTDSKNSAVYWKYNQTLNHLEPESISEHPGYDFVEIIAAGFQIVRTTGEIIFNVKTCIIY